MSATGRRGRKMQHLSTAFLIIALVIAVNGGVTAQDDLKADQIADESKNRAVTIIDGPKYVAPPNLTQPPDNQTRADFGPMRPEPRPEQRPPSKPPHPAPDQPGHHPEPRPRPAPDQPGHHPEPRPRPAPDQPGHHPEPRPRPAPDQPRHHPEPRPRPAPDQPGQRLEHRPHHSHVVHKGPPPQRQYKPKKLRVSPNSVYRFPRVIPLPSHLRTHYHSKPINHQPLVFAASNGRPVHTSKPPKFSVPVETINGIRADNVRPPKLFESSTTSTSTSTTTSTTTQRPLRNKRIWPKGYLEKKGAITRNTTASNTSDTANSTSTNSTDLEIASATHYRFKYVNTNRTAHTATTTFLPLTITRGYRRVSRVPKHTTTTTAYDIDSNYTRIEPNDWVPIVPPYHPKKRRPAQTPISRRSDAYFTSPDESPDEGKRTMYLQSYGLVPVTSPQTAAPTSGRKKMVIFRKKKRPLNPHIYSGYSPKPVLRSPSAFAYGDLQHEASYHPRTITRIKHHHHHHHHRYIKTVEKPVNVPYRVEVPRPYPVPVEKKVPVAVEKIKIVEKPVPYPVQVEKRVPYPVQVAVPHPVPYKVIEKEYIPKPYPVVQHVPVLKHVEVKVPQPVPVTVEKRVPYPVEVQVPVPVDRPYPVTVEKRVPYPVPVKVLVPQPYPVETKVPYPVEVKVKEPVEVVKHVPVRVPYPQPYPVKVPTPVAVPVEKRVPYPVEVEKKVPVPYKVIVPQKVEVEKRVPVYVPRIYPVEKKVPVPVKVPYPVKVPVYNEVPVYINPYQQQAYLQNYNQITRQVSGGVAASDEVTSSPSHVVTVHGNTGFAGFQSRSDKTETTSAESSDKTETTSAESSDKTETTSAENSDKTETTSSAESSDKTKATSGESSDRTETSSSYESSDRTNTSSAESTTKTQVSLSPKGFETSTIASTSAISTTITSS